MRSAEPLVVGKFPIMSLQLDGTCDFSSSPDSDASCPGVFSRPYCRRPGDVGNAAQEALLS